VTSENPKWRHLCQVIDTDCLRFLGLTDRGENQSPSPQASTYYMYLNKLVHQRCAMTGKA